MTKLILGTASFGIPYYGIKGDGQPTIHEIEKIAHIAWEGGIRVIHSSWQYGWDKYFDSFFDRFEWIEKDHEDPNYFHRNDKRGFSFYSNGSTWASINMDVDMIQIPINILDHTFLNAKYEKKYEVHARSVFLQGLLLMDVLPIWLSMEGRMMLKAFQAICRAEGLAYYEGALGWVLGLDNIDGVIVGVNSAQQLRELLAVKPLKWDYDFSIDDKNVLDPRRWPTVGNQLKRSVESSTAIEGVRVKL